MAGGSASASEQRGPETGGGRERPAAERLSVPSRPAALLRAQGQTDAAEDSGSQRGPAPRGAFIP